MTAENQNYVQPSPTSTRSRRIWLRRALALASLCTAFLLGGLSVSQNANASVLFENNIAGNNTANCRFDTACGAYIGAENFTLGADSLVEEFAFWSASSGTPTGISVEWWVYDDGGTLPGSTVLHSGTQAGSLTATGSTLSCCSNYDIYFVSVDIADLALTAGDYWLGLRVTTAGTTMYWADTTNGDGIHAQSMNDGATWTQTYGGRPNLAFQVIGAEGGQPPPVSAPATLLLLASGLFLVAARVRKS